MYTRGQKLIALIVIGIVIIITAVVSVPKFLEQKRIAREIYDEAYNYEDSMRKLETKKYALELEMSQINSDLSGASFGLGSTVILITTVDKKIASDIIPEMEEKGMVGAIGISDSEFPGDKGTLSVKDINKLVQKGWDVVAIMDDPNAAAEKKTGNGSASNGSSGDSASGGGGSAGNGSSGDSASGGSSASGSAEESEGYAENSNSPRALSDRIANAGLKKPSAFYYPTEEPSKSAKDEIKQLGGVIVQRESFEYADAKEGKTWRVKAMGSNESGVKNSLKAAMDSSQAMIITVGYDTKYERYTESNFQAMLRTVNEYVETGYLKVSGFDEAKKQSEMKEKLLAEKKDYLEKRLVEATAELEKVEAEIAEIR